MPLILRFTKWTEALRDLYPSSIWDSATTEHVVPLRDYDEANDTAVKLEQLRAMDENKKAGKVLAK